MSKEKKSQNTQKSIDFLEKHKQGNYYYVDDINKRLLIAVMQFLFEENAPTYIRKIRTKDEQEDI